jgi:DNA primase
MFGVADRIAKDHLRLVKVKDAFVAAACPFHKGGQERKPSFWISRETGHWGCFSCSAKGSSLKQLLRDIGAGSLAIEREIEQAEKEARDTSRVQKAQRKKKARAEFRGQYIIPDAVLGVFDWMPVGLLEEGFTEETLIEHDIGYDQRYNRITFPVRDIFGNIVGISGRATSIEDLQWGKYKFYEGRTIVNGKEVLNELGEWYPQYSAADVRNHLYRGHTVYPGLFDGTTDNPELIVVEGFKASNWMAQLGWHLNTVALMGTKMSAAQERLIRRLGAPTLVLTDNNQPGLDAAHEICQRLAVSSFPVYRCYYPDEFGEDTQPDDLSELELEEVLKTSKRYGGKYYVKRRMANKPLPKSAKGIQRRRQ